GHGWANVSNTPFRLYKQHDHEGGTRSPLIISWPHGLAHGLAGDLSYQVVHVMDLMPTLLEAVGADPSSPEGMLPFEGRSFLPLLQSLPERWQPRRELYWAHSRGKAARVDGWKLVSENKMPWELYKLPEDGTELRDLSNAMPQKVTELAKKHAAWSQRTNPTETVP
ncbi:MAG: sulfatase-like hydrolase/transferase, partial [Opitutae bacterium]|nr:sulfatase-like hydrolase/transferase [Opitutae bacterium]